MADNNIDLLDLNDPEIPGLGNSGGDIWDDVGAEKGKNLWKLIAVGVLALGVATYVVVKLAGRGAKPKDEVAAVIIEQSAPSEAEEIVQDDPDGLPQKVIVDRQEVKFNPAAGDIKVNKPKPLPVGGAKTAPKSTATKTSSSAGGNWSVQFGSLGSKAAAEREQKNLQSRHHDLFNGKHFTITTATLPGGNTTHRIRVTGFASGGDANNFCQRAKSKSLSCYAVPTGK
ncbi:MAG: SPOR domain-containing protein [Rickettsiales bacterium]|jgi:cell division septation protein DedD|nr:SPOR domain-containing protein [Rickettsiales bacterium]